MSPYEMGYDAFYEGTKMPEGLSDLQKGQWQKGWRNADLREQWELEKSQERWKLEKSQER